MMDERKTYDGVEEITTSTKKQRMKIANPNVKTSSNRPL